MAVFVAAAAAAGGGANGSVAANALYAGAVDGANTGAGAPANGSKLAVAPVVVAAGAVTKAPKGEVGEPKAALAPAPAPGARAGLWKGSDATDGCAGSSEGALVKAPKACPGEGGAGASNPSRSTSTALAEDDADT